MWIFFPWPHGRLFSCAGIFIHVLLQLFWQVVQIDQVMQQASKIVLFLADNEQHVFLEGCINCTGSKCCDEDDA